MSGHNKWSQIKHKKAKEDAKRGAAFTKVVKEIMVAAKEGGGDPATNARLRTLVEKAKDVNMPLDNITRAIKKGTGELPGVTYEQITYEGYGPHGSAVIVDTLTDNKNRTVAELRRLFAQKGGSLAETGSVSWMFEKMGVININATGKTEDDIVNAILDFNIIDVKTNDTFITVYTDPKELDMVTKALKAIPVQVESSELEWVAKSPLALPDDQSNGVMDFLSALQDHDDVQEVYANLA